MFPSLNTQNNWDLTGIGNYGAPQAMAPRIGGFGGPNTSGQFVDLSNSGGATVGYQAPTGGFDWGNASSMFGSVLGGMETIGNIWGGINSALLAKDQFKFQKEFANTNLNNSIKDYNSSLAGRMQARAAMETGDSNAYASQIADRQLTR